MAGYLTRDEVAILIVILIVILTLYDSKAHILSPPHGAQVILAPSSSSNFTHTPFVNSIAAVAVVQLLDSLYFITVPVQPADTKPS